VISKQYNIIKKHSVQDIINRLNSSISSDQLLNRNSSKFSIQDNVNNNKVRPSLNDSLLKIGGKCETVSDLTTCLNKFGFDIFKRLSESKGKSLVFFSAT
jgi:hypothetical protein